MRDLEDALQVSAALSAKTRFIVTRNLGDYRNSLVPAIAPSDFLARFVERMNSTEACIALNMVAKMGPVRLRKLLEVFETPERILAAKRSELRAIDGIGNEVAEQIANWESTVDLAGGTRADSRFRRGRDHGAVAGLIRANSARFTRRPSCSTFGAN